MTQEKLAEIVEQLEEEASKVMTSSARVAILLDDLRRFARGDVSAKPGQHLGALRVVDLAEKNDEVS